MLQVETLYFLFCYKSLYKYIVISKILLVNLHLIMKSQYQVVLSLGSNQGNRLENIENCINLIHQEIGTVVQVSKLYETPAWGFESEPFYNCAVVVHTHKSAHQVLDEVLLLEEALGRIRSDVEGYQARIIDIDVISFDEEIIASEKLKVPHPEMQKRAFVLKPLLDIIPNFEHPILKQSITQLWEKCPDNVDVNFDDLWFAVRGGGGGGVIRHVVT